MRSVAYLSLPICTLILLGGCSRSSNESGTETKRAPKGAGASRIAVKHANDPDAKEINTTPKDITVEELIASKMPAGSGNLEDYANSRVGEFERSTFRLKGVLKSVQHKKDGDYYLVMVGASGAEAIVEVPDPELCKGSPIIDEITAARDELEKNYHPTNQVKPIGQNATIEGVGFYGWKGKPGSGGSGRASRLMPGTGFKKGKA